ncbi:MAG TPA: response regulator [Dinghuibacter sp.]|uniref:response regulator n=1 Tax=Dinghuibacter sp. TaxID=2024697 RepID=UPI002CE43B26|nr:response regulator [Dinghuibacter sp.]HTJ15100.1 response regulator [Dinghuibacter sp.]
MQNKIQIAIVDDDKIFQLITNKTLNTIEQVGQIWQFYNGEEALVYLQDHAAQPDLLPDIILLDINMPVVDGWTFLKDYEPLLPSLSKTISIHMVSSSIDPKDIERANGIPLVQEYIIKPITKDKILDVIRQTVERQSA